MSRTILGLGSHGEIAWRVQNALVKVNLMHPAAVDGWFGPHTCSLVRDFQRSCRLTPSGNVDVDTWASLLPGIPTPSLEERCLAVTAAFEGHDCTLAVGNFDGAWLTWGIIGFTLKHGEVQKIISRVQSEHPEFIRADFGPNTATLLSTMQASAADQQRWADSISTPKGLLVEPWRTSFRLLGSRSEVQRIQQEMAHTDYFLPAQKTAQRFRLSTELGLALCFDIHVQNGGIKQAAATKIKTSQDERETWRRIAEAVVSCAAKRYQDDVRARKLTLASGRGTVHGVDYDLDMWGLADVPAVEIPLVRAASAGK